MLSTSKIADNHIIYLIYFIRCKFWVGRRRQLLPHGTSTAEAELAEGWRNKKILQALTSVTCSPSAFDAKGSHTSGHLSQAQILPLQEGVPRWDGASLPLVMCQMLWATSRRRTLGYSYQNLTSQAEMLSPRCTDSSPEDFYQGTFSFAFLRRWLSFAALEAVV